MVDGLADDFRPVGTFEQMMVQEVAACFWRKRRLLMFENRTAFLARDNRTFRSMNERPHAMEPLYVIAGRKMEGVDILDDAGLGLDLPGERDTIRLIRYEATITRNLKAALAQLKVHQKERLEGRGGAASEAQREPVIDRAAVKCNRGPEAGRMAAKLAVIAHDLEMERQEKEEQAEARAQQQAAAGWSDAPPAASEDYQTKPNSPADPRTLLQRQDLLKIADTVLKLDTSLAPKRRPFSD